MEACHYHSNRSGSWHCEGCHKRYCGQCVPGGEANFAAGQPRCLLCSQRLDWRGDGQPGTPFWKRSREILLYPLQPPALWLVLAIGVVSVLPMGLLAGLFLLFLGLVLFVYSLFVIEAVARDNWTPPSPMDVLSEGTLLFKQIALLLVLFVGPFLVASTSFVLAMGLLALAALILPAALMLLAVSQSLTLALNPLRWLQLISTVGVSYLLLWFAVMAVTAAPSLLQSDTPYTVLIFIGAAFSTYTTIVASAMMGALLNEKARQLGLADDEERGRSLTAEDYEVAEAMGSAHVYAQEGRLDDALRVVNRGLSAAPLHQELNWRRLRLLKLLGKDQPWQEHLGRFVRQQIGAGNPGVAVQAWLEAQQQYPGFRFDDDGALCLSLAKALYDRGRLKEARHLLVNLHQRQPGFRQLGEAYVLLARLYMEESEDLGRAGKLLAFVQRHFPDQYDNADAEQTRQLFQRLRHSVPG
ncbi:MAG: hypothetical protein MI745_02575 [Pseudomonadales bacterium]|nr:hypothetical protein [Pseudomonadales bacterium]